MKNRRRALRRFHRRRMFMRAMRSFAVLGVPEEYRVRRALRRRDNLQACSCWMCGHVSRIWGPRTSDLRQEIAARAELETVYPPYGYPTAQ